MTQKIIIAGGRDFVDKFYMSECINTIIFHITDRIRSNVDIEIVSGTANGADKLGEEYAHDHDYNVVKFPADWDRYKKVAGFIRNEQMAEYADVLIAFWDGESKGTKHMIDMAIKHGLEIHVFKY